MDVMHHQIHQIINKYDEALTKAETRKYILSFQISLDGFSFSLFNSETNKFLSIESVSFKYVKNTADVCLLIKGYCAEHSWLNQEFESIRIIFESSKSTLIPAPLFEESEKDVYSKFNFTVPEDHEVFYDKLSNLDAFNLYIVPGQLNKTLNEIFPSHHLISQSSVLIESLLIINKNLSAHKRAFVNVRNSYLDIIITDGRKLLYYNAFQYKTSEDFMYYVMFVFEQLHLNPEEIEMVLSGYIDRNSKLFDIAYKYVRNIKFQPYTDSFQYSYIFNDVPAHYYFNLLNVNLCEL